MPPGRVSSVLRARLGDWLIVLAVAAVGTTLLLAHPPRLSSASICPGLFELTTVVALRTWRDLSIGALLSTGNAAVLFASLALMTRVAFIASSSRLAAAAVGLAAVSSPLLVPSWSPTPSAALAACSACWLIGVSTIRTRASHAATSLASVACVFSLSAAIVPPLTIAFAAVAAWLAWNTGATRETSARVTRSALVALLVVALPATVLIVLSQTGSASVGCLLPRTPVALTATPWIDAWNSTGSTLLAAALALLGLWRWFCAPDHIESVVAWFAVVLFALLSTGGGAATSAPAMLSLWALCAIGLAEVQLALSGSIARRVGAVAIAATLVCLQILQTRSNDVPLELTPRGHEALSRNLALELVSAMPDDAMLVTEDAATDLVIRALPARARERRQLLTVVPTRAAATLAMSSARLYALPTAQRSLQQIGFQLMAIAASSSGLAEVLPGGACSDALTEAWSTVPALTSTTRFTFTSADVESRGPVYLFLASDRPILAVADDWPAEALRGFHTRVHDRESTGGAAALTEDLTNYGARGADLETLGDDGLVTRIEMWRTPDAPLSLTVALSEAPHHVIARLADGAVGHRVTLCPSFPHAITPIAASAR